MRLYSILKGLSSSVKDLLPLIKKNTASVKENATLTYPTYSNSFSDFNTTVRSAYYKKGTKVCLWIGVKRSTLGEATAFTLPAGYRPKLNVYIATRGGSGTDGYGDYCCVNTNGNVALSIHSQAFAYIEFDAFA